MNVSEQVLAKSPNTAKIDKKLIANCVDLCVACELACTSCADACLGEQNVQSLRRCIRLNLDCADVCGTTSRLLGRLLDADVELIRTQLDACVRACSTCAVECERHAKAHEHCAACRDACRRCEEQCRRVMSALPRAV